MNKTMIMFHYDNSIKSLRKIILDDPIMGAATLIAVLGHFYKAYSLDGRKILRDQVERLFDTIGETIFEDSEDFLDYMKEKREEDGCP